MRLKLLSGICLGAALIAPVSGAVIYNNLTPNNSMAIATRPGATGGIFEIEAADDFNISAAATINTASFVGLIVPGSAGVSSISQVVVEMYRVFPLDSTTPPS